MCKVRFKKYYIGPRMPPWINGEMIEPMEKLTSVEGIYGIWINHQCNLEDLSLFLVFVISIDGRVFIVGDV